MSRVFCEIYRDDSFDFYDLLEVLDIVKVSHWRQDHHEFPDEHFLDKMEDEKEWDMKKL